MVVGRLAVAVLLAVGWQEAVSRGSLRQSLPTFTATVAALGRILVQATTWRAVGHTVGVAAAGLALCVTIGVVVGLVLSLHAVVLSSTRFVVDFLRTIPPLAIIPLGILLYGPTTGMELLLIVTAAVWPIVLQTVTAVRGLDPVTLETARSFRLSLGLRLRRVVVPACLPAVAAGVRISATLCLLIAIGTELIAGVPGVGQEIALNQQGGNLPDLYAFVLLTGALGVALNAGLAMLEHRTLQWHLAPRAANA